MGASPERQRPVKLVPTAKITPRQRPVQTSDRRTVYIYNKLIIIVKDHQNWSLPGFFVVFLFSYILIMLRLVYLLK